MKNGFKNNQFGIEWNTVVARHDGFISTTNTRPVVIALPDKLLCNKHIIQCDYQISAEKATALVDHFLLRLL